MEDDDIKPIKLNENFFGKTAMYIFDKNGNILGSNSKPKKEDLFDWQVGFYYDELKDVDNTI